MNKAARAEAASKASKPRRIDQTSFRTGLAIFLAFGFLLAALNLGLKIPQFLDAIVILWLGLAVQSILFGNRFFEMRSVPKENVEEEPFMICGQAVRKHNEDLKEEEFLNEYQQETKVGIPAFAGVICTVLLFAAPFLAEGSYGGGNGIVLRLVMGLSLMLLMRFFSMAHLLIVIWLNIGAVLLTSAYTPDRIFWGHGLYLLLAMFALLGLQLFELDQSHRSLDEKEPDRDELRTSVKQSNFRSLKRAIVFTMAILALTFFFHSILDKVSIEEKVQNLSAEISQKIRELAGALSLEKDEEITPPEPVARQKPPKIETKQEGKDFSNAHSVTLPSGMKGDEPVARKDLNVPAIKSGDEEIPNIPSLDGLSGNDGLPVPKMPNLNSQAMKEVAKSAKLDIQISNNTTQQSAKTLKQSKKFTKDLEAFTRSLERLEDAKGGALPQLDEQQVVDLGKDIDSQAEELRGQLQSSGLQGMLKRESLEGLNELFKTSEELQAEMDARVQEKSLGEGGLERSDGGTGKGIDPKFLAKTLQQAKENGLVGRNEITKDGGESLGAEQSQAGEQSARPKSNAAAERPKIQPKTAPMEAQAKKAPPEMQANADPSELQAKSGPPEAPKIVEPPETTPPPNDHQWIEDFVKFLLFIAIVVGLFFLLRFLGGALRKPKPEDAVEEEVERAPEEIAELKQELAKIEREKLPPDQEVIRRYNFFLRVLDGTPQAHPLHMPTKDYETFLAEQRPRIQRELNYMTEVFCDLYYAEAPVEPGVLKDFRKQHRQVMKHLL